MADPVTITLDDVNTAIKAVLLGGQSYTLANGTVVTRANLASIQELRNQIVAEMGEQSAGGAYVPIGFGEPQ